MNVEIASYNFGRLREVMMDDLFMAPVMAKNQHTPVDVALMVMELKPTHQSVRLAKIYARRALRAIGMEKPNET